MNIVQTGTSFQTRGLMELGQPELRVQANNSDHDDHASELLRFLSNYISTTKRRILAGETLAYGYWLLRFENNGNLIDIWETDPINESWSPGASKAMRYMDLQKSCCISHGSIFSPPLCTHLVAISMGVLEGKPVEGVRYHAPEHMSGWYFTTDEYSGDAGSLKTVHLFHVTERRADLIKYLALAPGYYFDQAVSESAGYSQEVASQ